MNLWEQVSSSIYGIQMLVITFRLIFELYKIETS